MVNPYDFRPSWSWREIAGVIAAALFGLWLLLF